MIGWDIGGVNTKVARVVAGRVLIACGRPFELQRDPGGLVPLLRELASEAGADDSDAHAVTMTAELSQMFRTKREGVSFVLDAVEAAFPSATIGVYAVDGRFLPPAAAREEPIAVAAANWAATARMVARHHPHALLIDIGTTSTDIIPIAGGEVVADGRTDPARLVSGELVYTGAVRTPVEAIASHVPFGHGVAGLSAEAFALAGDVHVWRGSLAPSDYTCPTPDGRAATREFAGERLARAICADRDLVTDDAVTRIADALAGAQVERIAESIRRVRARHPSISAAVVTGLGAFIGEAAARAAGLHVTQMAAELGNAAARCAPAAAVAILLEVAGRDNSQPTPRLSELGVGPFGNWELTPLVQAVIKLGGGVLADPECFEAVLRAIGALARESPLVVVPGGGPFADAVRDQSARLGLSDEASHWMAVIAMDQYAHLIASRLAGAVLVSTPSEIGGALRAGRLPVLAPSRWLREADPLPHSWDVTSDSIAAWVAGKLGARQLVLVKPPHAVGELVDAYFTHAVPAGMTPLVIAADRIDSLPSALRTGPLVAR
ncbi:MAG TPA: hydantoinase/oxoprolinase family protein [Vicinamibacterales bacterium]|nr:hydantoinase/oxoprolinase family protein [Vicinamibacterales bacterium]